MRTIVLFTIGIVLGGSAWAAEPGPIDAKIAYYQARIGGPGTYPAYARLGLASFQKARETGQPEYHAQAMGYIQTSLSYQRSFEALFGMALGLSEHHHFKEALAYAQEALTGLPDDPEALGLLFDIQLALGSVPDAEGTLRRMLAGRAGFEALTRQAAFREYGGDIDGALDAMENAIQAAPDELSKSIRAWAQVRIGSLQMARCDASRAREAYLKALALFPGYYLANEHLAEWHAAQEHWKYAGALFQELLESHREPQYRLALAEVYMRENRPKEAAEEEAQALQHLRAAVRDGAQDQGGALALLLLQREEASTEALRLAQLDWEIRKDFRSADTLAWAYWRNGQRAEALRLSGEALKSGTKNPAVLLHAGIIRRGSGHVDEGRELLNQALLCPLAFGPRERLLSEQARE